MEINKKIYLKSAKKLFNKYHYFMITTGIPNECTYIRYVIYTKRIKLFLNNWRNKTYNIDIRKYFI